jgi:NAD(P)-dependent dehydrogenase (short-subunit alcohol dehydrogenase family)
MELIDMANDLIGKVAVITGAARGIGLSIAKELANRGAIIASADVLPFAEWSNHVLLHASQQKSVNDFQINFNLN